VTCNHGGPFRIVDNKMICLRCNPGIDPDWDAYIAIYDQDHQNAESGGWIQWKGTKVCMDVRCKCGWGGHVDAEFFYFMRCPACKQLFAVGQNVKLIALNEEQTKKVIAQGSCVEEPDL
jgi:hypothetical protein